jgi:hypothetical protein
MMTYEQKLVERFEFMAEDGISALDGLVLEGHALEGPARDAIREAIGALQNAVDALNHAYNAIGEQEKDRRRRGERC